MSEENVELIRQLYRQWEQGHYATAEFFDTEAIHTRSGADAVAMPGVWSGIDAMWKANLEWIRVWEDHRVRPTRFIDLGDRVLVISRSTGRARLSGFPLDHESAQLFTLRDGRIVRWDGYWEVKEALTAAGLED